MKLDKEVTIAKSIDALIKQSKKKSNCYVIIDCYIDYYEKNFNQNSNIVKLLPEIKRLLASLNIDLIINMQFNRGVNNKVKSKVMEWIDKQPFEFKVMLIDDGSIDEQLAAEFAINPALKQAINGSIARFDLSNECHGNSIKVKPLTDKSLHTNTIAFKSPYAMCESNMYDTNNCYHTHLGFWDDMKGLVFPHKVLNKKDTAINAIATIENKALLHSLLDTEYLKDEQVERFIDNNHVIKADMESDDGLFGLISLYVLNDELAREQKDLVFYLNNFAPGSYVGLFDKTKILDKTKHPDWTMFTRFHLDLDIRQLIDKYIDCGIHKVNIINQLGLVETITINPEGTRDIKILTDFNLSVDDEKRLSDAQLNFTGLAGPCDLTEALNRGLLPFVESDLSLSLLHLLYYRLKENQVNIGLTDQQIEAFKSYFNIRNHRKFTYDNNDAIVPRDTFRSLDLVDMAAAMKKVSDYLSSNENTLHLLPDIIAKTLVKGAHLSGDRALIEKSLKKHDAISVAIKQLHDANSDEPILDKRSAHSWCLLA
jgi:hypothetical protein